MWRGDINCSLFLIQGGLLIHIMRSDYWLTVVGGFASSLVTTSEHFLEVDAVIIVIQEVCGIIWGADGVSAKLLNCFFSLRRHAVLVKMRIRFALHLYKVCIEHCLLLIWKLRLMRLRVVLVSDREVITEGLKIFLCLILVLACADSALGWLSMRISWGLI